MISNDQYGRYRPPNSKWVIVKKQSVSETRLYTRRDYPSETSAAKRLDAGAFKLWCYLSKNKPDYSFALSNSAAKKEYGIGKSQYDKAVKTLIELEYLIEIKEFGKNNYYFVEYPDKYKIEDCAIGIYADSELLKFGNQTFKSHESEQLLDWKETLKSNENKHLDAQEPIETSNHNFENVLKTNNEMFDFQTVNDLEHDNQKYESNVRNKIDNINSIANIKIANFIYWGETITIPESDITDDPDAFLEKYDLEGLMESKENYYMLEWLSSHANSLANNLKLMKWLNNAKK